MTVSNKTTNKVHIASVFLFLIAAACSLLIAINLLTYALEVSALTVPLDPNPEPDPNKPQSQEPAPPSTSKKLADTLKQKNIFQPPPPKPQPPKEAQGILGDQALIAGKWYQVGDTVPPGAKVLKIEATEVTLEWEGKEIALAPINAASAPPPAKEPGKKPEMKVPVPPGGPMPAAPVQAVNTGGEDALAWLNIPARMRERFREAWNQMSSEQQQQLKDRWSNMSEEERRQMMMSFRPRGVRRPNRN